MKKKRFLAWVMAGLLCLSLVAPYSCETVSAMTVLETDVETASSGCTMLGVYGSYYSQAQEALDRINEIRKEACDAGDVPDPRDSSRMLTSSDYVPIKWSKDLESIARIRAMEGGLAYGFMASGHNRLNGKGTFSVRYNGVSSMGEDLAYNWGTSMVSGINQWYGEKSNWVNQVEGTVTGHYTSMINPNYTYVGLGDFYTEEATYPNTLAGEFSTSSQNLDQTMQDAQTDVMQKIEVLDSYITGYSLTGTDTIYTGNTTALTAKANLENGSKTHQLWVLDSLTYTSSNPSVATVTNDGVVTGLKNGTTTITAKSGETDLASVVITVKCNHPKELKSEISPTCTTTGLKVYSCDICGESIEQVVPKTEHDYIYGEADEEGYRTGICSGCGDTIQIIPPTTFTLWWRNSTSDSMYYYSYFPSSNPLDSIIYCWIDDVDGDSAYRDMVITSTDESVISVPETAVANSSQNKLQVIAPGITTLTIYAKYNPSLKRILTARIGDSGSVDITSADVTLSQTSYVYDGNACTPDVSLSYHDTVLVKGKDYTVTYENNKEAGTATAVITGTGIFQGTIRKDFSITTVPVTIDGLTYTILTSGENSGTVNVSAQEGTVLTGEVNIPSTIEINGKTYTVTTVEADAFAGQDEITVITIPSTVTTVESGAFSDCNSLESVTFSGTTAPVVAEDAFENIDTSALVVIVPENATGYETLTENFGVILQSEHVHSMTHYKAVAASCEQAGNTEYYVCQECNHSYRDEFGKNEITLEDTVIDATGHSWDTAYTVDVPATSTTDGLKSIHCSRCSAIKDQTVIPATGNTSNAGDSSTGTNTSDATGNTSNAGNSPTGTAGNNSNNSSVSDSSGAATDTDDLEEEDTEDEDDFDSPDESCPKVGETFSVKGITYKVVKSNPEDDEFTVSCIAVTSKNISKCNIPNYVSKDDFDFEVVSIGKKAFASCKKLKSVSLGDFVTTIGDRAFYGCISLKKITIPGKTKKIGVQAFSKCKMLSLVNIKSTLLTKKSVGKQAFSGINQKAVVKVPSKKKAIYRKWLKQRGVNGKKQQIK